MKLSLLEKILELSIFTKALAYKNGSLVFLSLPLSFGFVKSLKLILKDVDKIDIVLPILSISGCILLYFLFFIVDFSWGLIAAKHESENNPDWVKSDKLYNSIGKIGGVLLVDVLLLSIIIFLVVIGFVKISVGILVISVLLNVLAISYEIHSIGENIKRRTGEKPKFFSFFDKITNLLESTILNKIKNQID